MKFDLKNLQVKYSKNVSTELANYHHRENSFERGGILMGELYPNKNLVLITNIIEAPSQICKYYEYEMDVKFIQEQISKIWMESNGTKTYLGDWHTHPEKYPCPSIRDYITFSKNYFQSSIEQNFLIYIVFGLYYPNLPSTWIGISNGFRTKKYVL